MRGMGLEVERWWRRLGGEGSSVGWVVDGSWDGDGGVVVEGD